MTCPAHELACTRRFLDWEDVDLIRELTAQLTGERKVEVVDLGSGSGTTALAVLAERTKRLRIISIDHDLTALHWAQQAIANVGHSDCVEFLLADTTQAAHGFLSNIDFLLIDSSHEYAHTKAELAAWIPKVHNGGFVWLHDYRGPYPGVKRAIDEERGLTQIGIKGLGWAGRKFPYE